MPLRLQPGVCFRLHGDTPRGDRLGDISIAVRTLSELHPGGLEDIGFAYAKGQLCPSAHPPSIRRTSGSSATVAGDGRVLHLVRTGTGRGSVRELEAGSLSGYDFVLRDLFTRFAEPFGLLRESSAHHPAARLASRGGDGVPRGGGSTARCATPHPLLGAGALWFDRVADVRKLTALQAQLPSGEDVHRACDDQPENDQRDQRLHAHGQLGPMPQRHDVGRAKRGGVR